MIKGSILMKRVFVTALCLVLLTACQNQAAPAAETEMPAEENAGGDSTIVTTAAVTMYTDKEEKTVVEGMYLKGRDCDFIITDDGPVQIIGTNPFTGITDGDVVSVETGVIMQSWPAVAESKRGVLKLSDGKITDIPRNHVNSLAGCGWVEYYEKTGLYIKGKNGENFLTTGDDDVVMLLTAEDPIFDGFKEGERIRIGYGRIKQSNPPEVAQYFAEEFSNGEVKEIPQEVRDYLIDNGYLDKPVETEPEVTEPVPEETEAAEETTTVTETVTETETTTTAEVIVENMVFEGYYLNYNGKHMIIDPSYYPIILLNDDPEFDDLTDGDIIWVETDVVMESYPGQTYQFSVTKLSDGEYDDIPSDILASIS